MTISIIAAVGPNRELGKDNKLLWHISDDLKRFKKITQGHAVIMGRKTFESLGKPLPNRLNIIITRQRDFLSGKIITFASLKEAIDFVKDHKSNFLNLKSKDEVFVIGGGQIYAQALPLANKLYLTFVEKTPEHPDGRFEADTFFPEYEKIFTKKIFEEHHEENGYKYTFLELTRGKNLGY